MIVVDSSAVVAIMRRESEAPRFVRILEESPGACMSAVTFVETTMVIAGRRRDPDPNKVAEFVGSLGIEISAVSPDQAGLAVRAFLRFGKGRHRAALNLGDCFSYALAKSLDAPLLFKGHDVSDTDIAAAWQP